MRRFLGLVFGICLVLALGVTMAWADQEQEAMNALRAAEDLQSEGKNQEALSAYQEILEKYPDTTLKNDVMVKIARSYSLLGDDDSAIQTYLKLVSESPDTAEASQAVSLMMNLYYQRYRFDEVMAMAEHIGQQFPGTEAAAMALYRSAGYLYSKREYKKAIQSYETFMDKFPKSIMRSTAFNRLISLYTREGMFEQAELRLAEKLSENPTDKYMLRQLALVYQKQGNYDRALELYQKILAENPNDVDTFERLGELYAEKGDKEKAIAEWSKITASAPGQYSRHQMLAYILKSHGFHDQAAAEYQKAIELQPGIYYLYTQLADVYIIRKQFDSAMDVYLDALMRFPINHPNRSNLIRKMMELCELEGLHDKVASRLESHLVQTPDDVPVLLTLADFYFYQGRLDESLTHFRKFTTLNPDDGKTLFAQGQILERERQFDYAIEFYRAALDMSADANISFQALIHTGELKAQLRQPQEAIAILRRLITEIDNRNLGTQKKVSEHIAISIWLDAYMLMGDVYLEQMQDVPVALSTYTAAKRKLPPQFVKSANLIKRLSGLDLRMAECYRLVEEYDDAEILLDSMETNYKSRSVTAQIAKLRGDIYFSSGEFDEALIKYQEAIKWLMNEDWVNDSLDRMALIKGHTDHGPQSLLMAHGQIERLQKQGKYDEALEVCISAIKERGGDPAIDQIKFEMGNILTLQMKAQEALSTYQELAQSESLLAAEAQFRMASIYSDQLSDPAGAMAAYSVLIEKYPDSVLVADARKQIRQLASESKSGTGLP